VPGFGSRRSAPTGRRARSLRPPRTVLRSRTGPPSGYVVSTGSPGAPKQRRGGRARGYWPPGPGQTNFLDAQFSVAQLDSTVIMTGWSRERAAEDARAQGAFDVVRAIGQPYPVVK